LITPKIEAKEDYIQFSFIGIGHHGFDVNEQGEGVMRCNMNRAELTEIRNCITYFLSHNYEE